VSPDRKQAIAYLRECGQLQKDISFLRDVFAGKTHECPETMLTIMEHLYAQVFHAQDIVWGEVQGIPRILEKIKKETP
jgi:hypothetical protein